MPIVHLSDRIRVLLLSSVLAGCASTPPAPAPEAAAPATAATSGADYAALSRQPDAKVFAIDAARSDLHIYAFRGGRAAFAGHDHVLSSHEFSGFVYLPPKSTATAQFDVDLPLDRLVVDDPALRQQTGGAFGTVLGADDIAGTRQHMLGPDNLDAARFPQLHVHSTAVIGDLPRLIAGIDITLHGQTRSLLVPIEVHVDGDTLRTSGSFAVRQTDFGIKPYSVFGGLLSVQDELSVEFNLVAGPAHF